MLNLARFSWGAFFVLTACGRAPDPVGSDYQDLPADQVMIGVNHTMTNNGMRSAVGQFDTVYAYDDSAKFHLKGVNLELFDEAGNKTGTLTSLTGVLNTGTQAMTARGNVRLVTLPDNRIIESEELHYDPSIRRIWSDVATTMRHQGNVSHGDGFSADDKFQEVKIVRPRGTLPGIKIEF